MHPDKLTPLLSSVQYVKGVGPALSKYFQRLDITCIADLLFHFPINIIDRRSLKPVRDLPSYTLGTTLVKVHTHTPSKRGSKWPYRVHCADETGDLDVVFFNARADYIQKLLPPNERRILSGRVEPYMGKKQIAHPDFCVPESMASQVLRVEPIYPLTANITNKTMGRAIDQARQAAPAFGEWITSELIDRKKWPTWKAAIDAVHTPTSLEDLEPTCSARERLAYDELLAHQLTLALSRKYIKKLPGRSQPGTHALTNRLLDIVPFTLTDDQQTAIHTISQDLAHPERMIRLLQGDVGSGKTIVALFALLQVIESGAQGVMMAPTEILAQQHFEEFEPIALLLDIPIAFLSSAVKGTKRQNVLNRIASGEDKLIVGTHALFQEGVTFADLGLAVIDEQHRFGVHQRLAITEKGKRADTLLMTATPIPRTLLLTYYGDLEVSNLKTKPAGRLPIQTNTLPLERFSDVIEGLKRQMDKGEKIYWVCPLIEATEDQDTAAAVARYEELAAHFGQDQVTLIHGGMKAADKDKNMKRFSEGKAALMVATTVIEVGVNVPMATTIIIEHAERFGLAQLHQLRGRVGRSDLKSYCLLLYGPHLSPIAEVRLKMMRETNDGFRLAEEDLKLRGGGEILGTKQSGMVTFKNVVLPTHQDLIPLAHTQVKSIMDHDPHFRTPEGQNLRTLLYLHGKEKAITLTRA